MMWPWSVIAYQRKEIARLNEERAHNDKWIQVYQKLYLERSRDLYAAHKGIRRLVDRVARLKKEKELG